MKLEEGVKLGPYSILGPIGAGGMGEVFKARDTRLDRTVAIKVLPAMYAQDPALRSRFDREAKAISSLNHPNICVLYDIGRENGTEFLVLEYLEGETLGSRLKRGALQSEELFRYATQVADALERAHKQGLVHRDLKPANIMLTKDGAKLLDFGLAKLKISGGVVEGIEGITRTTPLTGEGTIIGTLQYMSPEQLEGKEADQRSDIFAFGALLFEMATGQRAFQGGSQASLIAAILKEEPRSISELQPLSPPMLDRAIRQCLAKDPDQRWQSAGDLKRALVWASEGGSQVGIPLTVSRQRRSREKVLWILSGLLLMAVLALTYTFLTRPQIEPRVARFTLSTTPGLSSVSWPRISPDGSMVAYVASDSTGRQGIYVRPLNSLGSHFLVASSGWPFWSTDSKQLAYFENNQLKKISINGGLAQIVCAGVTGSDGSWGRNGIILFDGSRSDSLRQVPATGGTPTAASTLDHTKGERLSAWPCFLPDGEHFLFLANDGATSKFTLKVGKIGAMEVKHLAIVDSRVEYANGHILYIKDNLLVAHPFDLGKLEFSGEPVPLSDGVQSLGERTMFSASNDGTLIFQGGDAGSARAVYVLDRSGKLIESVTESGMCLDFSLSPDDSKLAFGSVQEKPDQSDVWVRDLKRNVVSRLTFGPGRNEWPLWSHDGTEIIYSSNQGKSHYSIYKRNANGTGSEVAVLSKDSSDVGVVSISKDGRQMLIQVAAGNIDLWIQDETGKAEPFLTQPYAENRGDFSPDGKFLAYQSAETGDPEIYIRELTASGGKWQVSSSLGRCPIWSADGKELYYVTPEFDFMSAPISYENGLNIGTPVKLFNHRYVFDGAGTLNPYDVTSDNQRFYVLSPINLGGAAEFVVVQNWVEELKK